MFNVWFVAAGALALAATTVIARLLRGRFAGGGLRSSADGVSEEWLSNARSQRDEGV